MNDSESPLHRVVHLVNSIRDNVELPITYVPEHRNITISLTTKNIKNDCSVEEIFPLEENGMAFKPS